MSRILSMFFVLFLMLAPLFAETPPSAPGLISPANGFVATNTWAITHTWTASTDDILVTNYTFVHRTNGANPITNHLGTNSLLRTNTYTSNQSYTIHWWVLARDNSNNVTSSATNTYTITNQSDVTPPSLAIPTYPLAGTLTNSNVTFTWGAATDNVAVSYYTLFLQTNGSYWTQIYSTLTNASTNVLSGFTNTVSWFVKAYDAAGNNSTTATNSFVWTVPAVLDTTPPTAPVANSPATSSNHTATNCVFSWAASTDNVAVTGYQLVYLTNGFFAGSFSTGSTSFSVGQAWNKSNGITWFVKAYDAAGNTNTSASNTFTWNTVTNTNAGWTLAAPTLISPLNLPWWTNTYDFTFVWSAPSSTYAVTGYWFNYLYNLSNGMSNALSLGGSNWISSPTTNFYTNFPNGVAHSNGGIRWFLTAVDASNHISNSATVSFKILSNASAGATNDTTPPRHRWPILPPRVPITPPPTASSPGPHPRTMSPSPDTSWSI